MCLSNVYTLKNDCEKELLCKNIASVLTEKNKLVFTNILGHQTSVYGEITQIDLIENNIYVRTFSKE